MYLFKDGFAKGLLISHTSANDKKKPFAKLKSTILYLTVAAVIVYAFVTCKT
jgi:hypothetical protein